MSMSRRNLLLGLTAAVVAAPTARARGSVEASATPAAEALRPPPLLLAHVDMGVLEPAQCLVSEKFDGVRAYWDGSRLQHRSGRAVAAPT